MSAVRLYFLRARIIISVAIEWHKGNGIIIGNGTGRSIIARRTGLTSDRWKVSRKFPISGKSIIRVLFFRESLREGKKSVKRTTKVFALEFPSRLSNNTYIYIFTRKYSPPTASGIFFFFLCLNLCVRCHQKKNREKKKKNAFFNLDNVSRKYFIGSIFGFYFKFRAVLLRFVCSYYFSFRTKYHVNLGPTIDGRVFGVTQFCLIGAFWRGDFFFVHFSRSFRKQNR